MKFCDIIFFSSSFAPAAISKVHVPPAGLLCLHAKSTWNVFQVHSCLHARFLLKKKMSILCVLLGVTFINRMDSRVRNSNESTFSMFTRAKIRFCFWLEMMIFILQNCKYQRPNPNKFQQSIHLPLRGFPTRQKMKWMQSVFPFAFSLFLHFYSIDFIEWIHIYLECNKNIPIIYLFLPKPNSNLNY